MEEIVECVRARVRAQLAVSPDTDSWDEVSRDRLLLLQEITRYLRLSSATPHTSGKHRPPNRPSEYTGDTCSFCGSLNMRRAGNCSRCDNCGESGGCS